MCACLSNEIPLYMYIYIKCHGISSYAINDMSRVTYCEFYDNTSCQDDVLYTLYHMLVPCITMYATLTIADALIYTIHPETSLLALKPMVTTGDPP